MIVLFQLRCPGRDEKHYNEAEVELDWTWPVAPRNGELVRVDGVDFHVTAVHWRLDEEPPLVIRAEVDRAMPTHKADWLSSLGPRAFKTFVDVPHAG